jgi:hypothetical protein
LLNETDAVVWVALRASEVAARNPITPSIAANVSRRTVWVTGSRLATWLSLFLRSLISCIVETSLLDRFYAQRRQPDWAIGVAQEQAR